LPVPLLCVVHLSISVAVFVILHHFLIFVLWLLSSLRMATRAVASAVLPYSVDKVWNTFRDFTFPGRFFSTVSSCSVESNQSPFTVGATRVLKYATGEQRKDRLLELRDKYHRVTREMIESDPIAESAAAITTIKLYRITEQNHTLVEWACDFSADTPKDLVLFNQKAFLENLKEIRSNFTKST